MSHWFRAVLALVFCFQPTQAQRQLPGEKPKWVEARTANFRIFSQLTDNKTKDIALEFEALRRIFLYIAPHPGGRRMQLDGNNPVDLFLFKDQKNFKPYCRFTGAWGMFIPQPWGNYMLLNAEHDTSVVIGRHEYVHYLVSQNFGRVPVWINEGLAEFYSTAKWDKKTISIGMPYMARLQSLRAAPPMPLGRLVQVGLSSPEYSQPRLVENFYASCWLVTHYLLTDIVTQPKVWAFLRDLQTGMGEDEAFAKNFGITHSELDKKVVDHMNDMFRGGRVKYWGIDAGSPMGGGSVETKPLTRQDALSRLGILALSESERERSFARAHFDAALAVAPKHPLALYGLGLLSQLLGRRGEAERLFIEAAPGCPEEAAAHRLAGWAYLHRYMTSDGGNPADIALGREHLLHSIKLHPGSREIFELLVAGYEIDPSKDDLRQGIDFLMEMYAKRPWSVWIYLLAGKLQYSAGDYKEAAKTFNAVLALQPDKPTADEAKNYLGMIEARQGRS